MAEMVIECSKCGTKIPLDEALTNQIRSEVRTEYDVDSKAREQDFQEELQAKDKEHEEKLAQNQAEIEKAAQERAKESSATELKDLQTQLKEKSDAIGEARDKELKFLEQEREFKNKIDEVDVEIARRVAEGRDEIKADAEETLREDHKLQLKEKDTKLERVVKQLEEAQKKAAGKSQELQGEVLELELEELLRTKFPTDEIEPVKKGVRGADVTQRVRSGDGKEAGTILWETKRTKAWGGAWTGKLKEDQRREKAHIAVIVSDILPESVTHFGTHDGVTVTAYEHVAGLAVLLRNQLIDVARVQTSLVDKSDKMEILYDYLSGNEFKQRVDAIVESYSEMLDDLAKEKRAIERLWAKREKQLNRAMTGVTGMHGDLQGIIGAVLPAVETLQLPAGDDNNDE